MTVAIDADLEVLPHLRDLVALAPRVLSCPVDGADLELLVSELGANAVQARSTWIRLGIDRVSSSRIRVSMTDDGCGTPVLRHPGPLDPDGGRGLMIVDAISSTWGIVPATDEDLTTVWFDLDVPS